MDRTAGIMFDYGVFTNLSPDHIGPNEHASFEEYLECKSMLFRQCKIGILNADDEHSEAVAANHTCEIHSFGVEDNNEKTFLVKPLDLNQSLQTVVTDDDTTIEIIQALRKKKKPPRGTSS